jgi:hypothetical protein
MRRGEERRSRQLTLNLTTLTWQVGKYLFLGGCYICLPNAFQWIFGLFLHVHKRWYMESTCNNCHEFHATTDENHTLRYTWPWKIHVQRISQLARLHSRRVNMINIPLLSNF